MISLKQYCCINCYSGESFTTNVLINHIQAINFIHCRLSITPPRNEFDVSFAGRAAAVSWTTVAAATAAPSPMVVVVVDITTIVAAAAVAAAAAAAVQLFNDIVVCSSL